MHGTRRLIDRQHHSPSEAARGFYCAKATSVDALRTQPLQRPEKAARDVFHVDLQMCPRAHAHAHVYVPKRVLIVVGTSGGIRRASASREAPSACSVPTGSSTGCPGMCPSPAAASWKWPKLPDACACAAKCGSGTACAASPMGDAQGEAASWAMPAAASASASWAVACCCCTAMPAAATCCSSLSLEGPARAPALIDQPGQRD